MHKEDLEEVDKEDKQVVHKEAVHQTPIVRRLIRSAQSLASVNVQHISQGIQSAGLDQQEEEEEEAVLQMPIAQLLTRSALNLVSASVSATSLATQSAGAKEKQCAAAVRLEETLAAILTRIVLPPTQFAPSLAFASAAAISRERRSVGGEETLCAVDRGQKIVRRYFSFEYVCVRFWYGMLSVEPDL